MSSRVNHILNFLTLEIGFALDLVLRFDVFCKVKTSQFDHLFGISVLSLDKCIFCEVFQWKAIVLFNYDNAVGRFASTSTSVAVQLVRRFLVSITDRLPTA